MAVTLKDIADKVGVHVSTVSRVMNNRGYISEDLKKKVDDAVKDMNYYPNAAAKALFQKKSFMMGLIVPDVSVEFFGRFCKAAEKEAYAHGYEVLVCNSDLDVDKEKRYMDLLMADQVDGIIMASQTIDTAIFSGIDLPVVSVDRVIDENIPYVVADNYKAGEIAANLLLEGGCRKPAIVCGFLKLNMTANDRYRAFCEVMAAHHIPVIVKETDMSGFNTENYKNILTELLTEHKDIDAIFTTSDLIAAYALKTCREMGFMVPDDIQLVGVDGTRLGQVLSPVLTSIALPVEQMGYKAVRMLIEQIESGRKSQNSMFDVMLLKGQTTKEVG